MFLQHHYMSSGLSFCGGFHMVLKDRSPRGSRQGKIRHAPKTKDIAPLWSWTHLGLRASPWTSHRDTNPSRSAQGRGQAFSSCW
jgi:hypothetical protein